jgi:hypothetical protein
VSNAHLLPEWTVQVLYQLLLYAHVLAVVGFALAHGTAALMAFSLRRALDANSVRALLTMSNLSAPTMYLFLVLTVFTGVGLGFVGHFWSQPWIWVSLALLIVTTLVMVRLGSRYDAVRKVAGISREGRITATIAPGSVDDLQSAVAATHPALIGGFGVAALGALLWLMVMKPF